MENKNVKGYMQGQQGKFGSAGASGGVNAGGGRVLSMVTHIAVDEPRLLIYSWNEMINVLEFNSINDPTCFGIAIAWVSRMVDMFMKVHVTKEQRESNLLRPDSNSVLKIFASKLFCAANTMSAFHEAKAIALGCLCRIFCQRPDTVFDSESKYLLNFYATLRTVLTDKITDTAREQVIFNGAQLFSCDFPGIFGLFFFFDFFFQRETNII